MRRLPPFPTHGSHHRGFALLLVVGCLLVVTVAAVSASRHSLGLSLDAVALEDQVQRRWELLTLERVGLTTAVAAYGGPPVAWSTTSDARELAIQRRSPAREFQIRLNGRTYQVLVADESAKANLNMVAALNPPQLADLTRALTQGRLQVAVPPGVSPKPAGSSIPILFDWCDVLPRRGTGTDERRLEDRALTAAHLTTWGDGRINLLSATDPVLFELSRLIVSDGESRDWIAEFRESFPRRAPTEIFTELGFDPRPQRQLLEMLATQSTAVSVWIAGEQQSSLCIATRRGTGTWQSAVVWRSQASAHSAAP